MGFDLSNASGGYQRFNGFGWGLALYVAEHYGWKPAGTVNPVHWTPDDGPWTGEYALQSRVTPACTVIGASMKRECLVVAVFALMMGAVLTGCAGRSSDHSQESLMLRFTVSSSEQPRRWVVVLSDSDRPGAITWNMAARGGEWRQRGELTYANSLGRAFEELARAASVVQSGRAASQPGPDDEPEPELQLRITLTSAHGSPQSVTVRGTEDVVSGVLRRSPAIAAMYAEIAPHLPKDYRLGLDPYDEHGEWAKKRK